MRTRFVFLVAAASPSMAAVTSAQQSPDTATLRPIVITATRVPVHRHAAPATVTVLAGDALRARGVASVADALASVPGITVVRSGSFGATTALFARGGESDYVKVLVDGVPVNNPGGAFDFASLTTDNIDRIEVVRGPASVMYGSDAVTGVVQLFTRRGDGPAHGFADVRGGSYGTLEGTVGFDGGSSGVQYAFTGAARESDGIYAFNNGYRNRLASGRLVFVPSLGTIDLTARHTDATYHFPTNGSGAVVDSNAVRRDQRTSIGLELARQLTQTLELRVVGAASRLDGVSSNQPDSPGDSAGFYGEDDMRTERRSAEVRADFRPTSRATVSLGAAVEREQVGQTSESRFASFPATNTTFDAHRTNEAVYAQAIAALGRGITLTASGRVDENATYGTFVTGRGSVAWDITSTTSVRAALGNAFKAPAFEETFSSAFTVGNPDLDPERTMSWEAAVEHRVGERLSVSATYFDQRFRDLIQYVDGNASTDFRGTNQNLGAAIARGVELEARAPRLGQFDLGASWTALETRVTDAGNGAFGTFVNGERLLRRPGATGTLDAGYRVSAASRLGLVVRFVGERDDRDFDNQARVTLGSYTVLDLSGELALGDVSARLAPLTLTARVENALDREYFPAFGFLAPGRTVLLGLRARFGG
ncbi:MAG TPA: TonB-dependent receptor [Gemmatimonadaceae bacterium]|nr:TonB-dependent receptor [Gemmatimonadaceae bacterium]